MTRRWEALSQSNEYAAPVAQEDFQESLDWAESRVHNEDMTSTHFTTTLATIAVKAQARWQFLTPERCVDFAWFSVSQYGDAAEDNDDLVTHFRDFVDANGWDIPGWMI